jgi:hypothetical protein
MTNFPTPSNSPDPDLFSNESLDRLYGFKETSELSASNSLYATNVIAANILNEQSSRERTRKLMLLLIVVSAISVILGLALIITSISQPQKNNTTGKDSENRGNPTLINSNTPTLRSVLESSPSPTSPPSTTPSSITPVSKSATATSIPTSNKAPALIGAGVYDPYTFGDWLGHPLQVWETWNSAPDWGTLENLETVDQYYMPTGVFGKRWSGKLSIGMPMWAKGESASVCASGTNDNHIKAIANGLINRGWNNAYIRLGLEFNADWFPQNEAYQDPSHWVTCWQRWYNIFKSLSPNFKFVWNPNSGTNTGNVTFDPRNVWPGDQYVDVAGPDYYDWSVNPNAANWVNGEVGIYTWVAFVASHKKPFAVPEWGLNQNGDNSAFIQQMYDAFQSAKNSPTGLEYQSYFDLDNGNPDPCVFEIHTDGCNPQSAAKYKSLFGA